MEDEQSEENNYQDNEVERRDIEKWEFALSILKEAVANAGIKDISEYKGEPLTLRWHIFSQEIPNNLLLRMFVNGIFGTVSADIELIIMARWIVDETSLVLNQPDANRLFDFTDEERPEILRENAGMIISALIKQMPVVAYQILTQSLRDAIQSHIKTYVEPILKDHWQSLGLAKGFTVTPSKEFNDHLQQVEEQFEALKKSFLGNKRARLTDERFVNLANEHEQLRSAYESAKEYYNQQRKAFFAGRRNRTPDEWEEEWKTSSLRMFPDLFYRCLYEINDYTSSELAHIHLADFYGYKPQYMVKLVSKSSGLRPKKGE